MYHSSIKKIKETDLNLNNEIYPNYFGGAWMKIFSEKMSEFYSRLGRNKYTVIRHSNVYGPHDKFDWEKSKVIPALIRRAVEKHDPFVVWGDGMDVKDFIYIDDYIDGILLTMEKLDEFQPINKGFYMDNLNCFEKIIQDYNFLCVQYYK